MAGSGEVLATQVALMETDDTFGDDRGDGKKKKFKPFQKMKNFFRGGSSKKRFKVPEGASGSVKSQSTGALHNQGSHPDDDEDDGGFGRAGKGPGLGSRSISEDSIFKPDTQKETPAPVGVLAGQAVSMERINSDFQSELFSKLRGRQSDSDIDEGLPYSPNPNSNIFDAAMKAKASSSIGPKPLSQDSEQSLISVDGSEEDLFDSKWSSSVASVKTRTASIDSTDSIDTMEVSDFEVVQRTGHALSSEAAKHRISVKPKTRRLSSKKSFKNKEKPSIQTSLPDVTEEPTQKSPVREIKQDEPIKAPSVQHKTVISTTIPIGNPPESNFTSVQRSEPKDIPQSRKVHDDLESSRMSRSLSPLSTSPVSQSMLQDVKLRSRPLSGKFDHADSKKVESASELSQAFNKAKRFSRKYDAEGKIIDNSSESVKPAVAVKVDNKATAVTESKVKVESKVITETKAKTDIKSATDSKVKVDSKISTDTKIVTGQKPEVSVNKTVTQKDDTKKDITVSVLSSTKDSTTSTATTTTSPTSPGVSYVLKKEPLRPGSKVAEVTRFSGTKSDAVKQSNDSAASITVSSKTDTVAPKKVDDNTKPVNVVVTSVNASGQPSRGGQVEAQSQSSTQTTTPTSALLGTKTVTISQKLGSPEKLPSPREEYRLKRHSRSKTLPVSKELVDKAEELEKESSAQKTSRAESPPAGSVRRSVNYDNVVINTKTAQQKRMSWAPSSATTANTEPSWVTKAKQREKENEKQAETAKKDSVKEVRVDTKSSVDIKSSTDTKTVTKSVESEIKPAVEKTVNQPVRTWAKTVTAKPFEKPAVDSSSKPVVQSSSVKTFSQSVRGISPAQTSTTKPPIPASTTKPLSQSVRPAFDSKVSSLSSTNKNTGTSFERSFSQKSGTSKPAVEPAKTGTQSSVKPLGTVNTNNTKSENKDLSTKPSVGSVSDSRKMFLNQENKKIEIESKKDNNTNTTKSSFDRSKLGGSRFTSKGDSNVPEWKKQVNIEIIDKEPDKKKLEVKKTDNKVEEKTSTTTKDKGKTTPEKCSDSRSSKVLDMVKSFQKLQVT